MNYYKRHLGDYAAATRHLSMIEHGAYTLLLDVYYIGEKPLPNDERAIWRLVGARSKDEREAVSVILQEFFTLEADGWHQTRCDEEIGKKQAKAEVNREIGKRGGRPKKETVTVPEKNPDGFQEKTQTVSENNPSHKPIANSQEPKEKQTSGGDTLDQHREDDRPPPPAVRQSQGDPTDIAVRISSSLRVWEKARGKFASVTSTNCADLAAMQPTDTELREAYDLAVADRDKAHDPSPVNAGFVATFLAKLRAPARPKAPPRDDWHRSDAGTDRKARELGMFAHGGESYDSFRQRIWAEIKRRENATSQGAA